MHMHPCMPALCFSLPVVVAACVCSAEPVRAHRAPQKGGLPQSGAVPQSWCADPGQLSSPSLNGGFAHFASYDAMSVAARQVLLWCAACR